MNLDEATRRSQARVVKAAFDAGWEAGQRGYWSARPKPERRQNALTQYLRGLLA